MSKTKREKNNRNFFKINFKRLKKRVQGITLIALVVTVIVLLILAGVALNLTVGDNGLFKRAQNAADTYDEASQKEKIELAAASTYLDDTKDFGITTPKLESALKEQFDDGTEIMVEDNGNGSFYIVIDKNIYYLNQSGKVNKSEDIATDGSWSEEKGVNTPVIKSDLPNNMTMELVKWDEESKSFVNDSTKLSYNYVAGSGTEDNNESKWANARVKIDGIESYFVWIPRYEYKIDNTTKTIDIKFIPKSQTKADDGYIIHPAFINDSTNNYDNGGWREELSGIWVGKYESSRIDAGIDVNNPGTSTKMKVQEGVTSWINTSIGETYDYAKEYCPDLNSHMLKNSEWGAVAYLTHSKYGRNGNEIDMNNNSNFITADQGIEINSKQSTTGNVYGIFDLSGCADEYVSAYYGGSTDANLSTNGSQLINETNREYVTEYDGETTELNYKLGDATYETENWNLDSHGFINSKNPFFKRGSTYNATKAAAGIFKFSSGSGTAGGGGFHLCLAI